MKIQLNTSKTINHNNSRLNSPKYYYAQPFNSSDKVKFSDGFSKSSGNKEISFSGLSLKRKAVKFLNRFSFVRFSKFDTPEVKQIRHKVLDSADKVKPPRRMETPEGIQLRTQIISRLLKEAPNVARNKDFYIVYGVQGAGKSTLSGQIASVKKAFHIDYDKIKFEIPEYKNNPLLDYTFGEEATRIKNNLLDAAVEKGYSIIIEDCGYRAKDTLRLIKKMKSLGYNIHLVLVDTPRDEAVKRAFSRFKETGRFSDPLFHNLFGNKPLRNYQKIISSFSEYLSSYAIYSSNVPKGELFKFVSGTNLDLQ